MSLIDRDDRLAGMNRSGKTGERVFAPAPQNTNVVTLQFRADQNPSGAATRPLFQIAKCLGTDKPASQKLLFAAIAMSAALHAGLIAASLLGRSDEQFGTLSDNTNTFSLSMEQSVVLESISTDATQAAAAASAATQAGSVQSAESTPQELAELENDLSTDEPPQKPIEVADVTPTAVAPTDDPLLVIRGDSAPDSVNEVRAEQIAEIQVKEMPEAVETKDDSPAKAERKKEIEKEKKTPQKESHQQIAGSATSRSNASQAAENGRVSASRGNALSYGASVRAQLARNKPSSDGIRGTVRVSFGIAMDGGLRYLRLSESSGIAKLDEAALAAIRKTVPFGAPPSDLTSAQLSYVIPFYFR